MAFLDLRTHAHMPTGASEAHARHVAHVKQMLLAGIGVSFGVIAVSALLLAIAL